MPSLSQECTVCYLITEHVIVLGHFFSYIVCFFGDVVVVVVAVVVVVVVVVVVSSDNFFPKLPFFCLSPPGLRRSTGCEDLDPQQKGPRLCTDGVAVGMRLK